jgi:hypothetical protein
MKPISHRGNLEGKIGSNENTTHYVNQAMEKGYDVEIDVRFKDNTLYMGHDEPDEEIIPDWLLKNADRLWIHCKDLDSMIFISKSPILHNQLNYFGHSQDPFVLTSKGFLFCLPSDNLDSNCVLVMPEHFNFTLKPSNNAYAVLTDYPTKYKDYKQW